jgi:Carboxypeptidase regulatory-like domain
MRFRQSQFLSGFLLLLVCAGAGLAQNATGAITGTVTDPNNDVVSNAIVTVTNKATGAVRKVTTRGGGVYSVENLFPGEYEVKVEAQGFITQLQALPVVVGNTTTGNFSMTVGGTSQTIEVTAAAPIINTTDTTVGGVVNRERVESLPLNGRSFLSVAALEPGVSISYAANSGAGNPNNFFQISIGGAPQQMTVISVDGSRVNDRVTGGTSQNFSAETVQEFQISTLGFDLSSGTVSAGVVNIVSRTGSNDLHGSGFFFFRDHNMAAFTGFKRPCDPTARNPLCDSPSSLERLNDPFFVRRQYGGTVGGPIKKDKLFFFGNYERNNQVGARPITFSDPAIFGYSHIAQQPTKGNLAGLRLDYTINQKHSAFLRFGLDNNNGIAGTNLETTWIASDNFSYQTQMGLTSVLSSRLVNDFRFSYSYFRNRLTPPTQAQCEQVSGDPALCFGLNGPLISLFGTSMQIGTNVNVSQDRHPRTYQWTDNVNWTAGSHRVRFGGNWEHSNNHGTWNRNAPGSFSSFSPTQLQSLNRTLYDALPASLKTGYTGPRATFAELLQLPMGGATTPTLSIGVGSPSQPAPYRYNEVLANDLVRFYIQDGWQLRPGFTLNYGLGWSFETNVFYDDIDLPQYLKPLLGDKLGGPKDKYKNFDPALGFAWALGKEKKTVVRASASLHHTSPNVGFFNLNQRILFGPAGNGLQAAVGSVLQNPEVATRCGSVATNPTLGCLNFTAPSGFTLADMLAFLPAAKAQLTADTSSRFNGQDLSIRGVQVTKTVQGAGALDAIYNSDSSVTPYTFHVNAGVQREIAHNLAVSADYVMRRGVGFGAFEGFFPDINRWNDFAPSYSLIPTGGSAGTVNPASLVRTPLIPACVGAQGSNPNFQCSNGPIQYGLPGILSRYSALQVKVDKRFSSSFQFTGAYALSRYTTFAGGTNGLSNNNNLYEGHGVSGGNPRHRFTFSGIWDLPKFKGDQRFLRSLLNGWQLSTLMEMHTGNPTTVTLPGTLDIDGDGTFTFRLPGTGVSSFGYNMSADDIRRLVDQYNASIPAPKDTPLTGIPIGPQRDAIGTALPYIILPINFQPDDSFLTHDLRVTRNFKITEKVGLNLIGEGFNIFNIANLNGYGGTLNAYVRPTATAAGRNPDFTFGQPTGRVSPVFGTGGPRAFQLAARLSF